MTFQMKVWNYHDGGFGSYCQRSFQSPTPNFANPTLCPARRSPPCQAEEALAALANGNASRRAEALLDEFELRLLMIRRIITLIIIPSNSNNTACVENNANDVCIFILIIIIVTMIIIMIIMIIIIIVIMKMIMIIMIIMMIILRPSRPSRDRRARPHIQIINMNKQ